MTQTEPEYEAPSQTVLLASPADLGTNSVGALFLRDAIASQPDIRFVHHREAPFLMGGKSGWVRLLSAASARFRGLHSVRLRWFRTYLLRERAAAIASEADRVAARTIWVPVSSPELVWIGEKLADAGRDVRVTVLDAPEYLSSSLRLDARLQETLMQSFEALLHSARAVSTVGYAMRERYNRAYGVESEVIRHGIASSDVSYRRATNADEVVRVVFAGSLYSKEEWNSFVAALDSVKWTLGDRPVAVYFMGRFPLTGAHRPPQVRLLGEKPFDEALRTLATMHIGYLPYWFDKAHEVAASTSFPGKMSAYAAAGLAVFHHAPAYTEGTAFLREYPFGLACPSLEAKDILETLERLVGLAVSEEYRLSRRAAMRNELSRTAMAIRLRRFLGAG